MKIIYTDESMRLKDLAAAVNSKEFRMFVDGNIRRISKYDHGMERVKPDLCKPVFDVFLKDRGFVLGSKTEHANGIGNNNMTYVQDLGSGEFIGALHINSNMSGSVYCYATDIHKNRVSTTYSISSHGISLERAAIVDWTQYVFGDINAARNAIQDALDTKVLVEGPTGGVLVYKAFDNGTEGWTEVSKEEAAKDLLEQGEVDTLLEAIKNRSKRSLKDQIQDAASRVDPENTVSHQNDMQH